MKRTIIKIDEELCNGCGACIDGCHEGALQLIDDKARVISDLFCDGLGACIGECPVGAITLEEREAVAYDERAVMEQIVPKGEKTVRAHLLHLKEHNEAVYLRQGLDYLKEKGITLDLSGLTEEKPAFRVASKPTFSGCPGSQQRSFKPASTRPVTSALRQWPVQLHLLNPQASFLQGEDVVIAADCTAYAYGDFHNRFMKGHALTIACPKLDSDKQMYVEKITAMVDHAGINTLTVVIMEVPCCRGLTQLVKLAVGNAARKVPVKQVMIGIEGEILREEWI